jgi:uncharacterized membrane protein
MDITPIQDATQLKKKSSQGLMHMFDGVHLKFPTYKHNHPAVINVNEVADEKLTFGQKIADKVATGMGSWNFIIGQSIILLLWIVLNSVGWFIWKWDQYPFIAMNLLLSCEAAFAAPIIMMSQNRQADKDRLTAQNDYQTDCKGEEEIRHIMEHLDHQDELILQVVKRLEDQHMEMRERLALLDPVMAQHLGIEIKQVSEELADAEEGIAGNS